MIQELLLRIVRYCWLGFGAYWVGVNFVRKRGGTDQVQRAPSFRPAFLAATFAILFYERNNLRPALLITLCVLWAGLSLYWVAARPSGSSGEFPFYRVLRLIILAATFALLFWNATAIGFLARPILPSSAALAIVGLALAILGLAVALWARVHLGNNWSDKVVLQQNHELIRAGPYAYMRHPIYSGVLLGVLGTAVILDRWRGIAGFALLLANYVVKAKKEERLLSERFSNEFQQHRNSTGFLFPRFHS